MTRMALVQESVLRLRLTWPVHILGTAHHSLLLKWLHVAFRKTHPWISPFLPSSCFLVLRKLESPRTQSWKLLSPLDLIWPYSFNNHRPKTSIVSPSQTTIFNYQIWIYLSLSISSWGSYNLKHNLFKIKPPVASHPCHHPGGLPRPREVVTTLQLNLCHRDGLSLLPKPYIHSARTP